MRAGAKILLALLFLLVALAGVAFLWNVDGASEPSQWLSSSLPALEVDGPAVRVRLSATRRDAWRLHCENTQSDLFVRRRSNGEVVAFLPYHLSNGIKVRVEYHPQRGLFHSVCRKVVFDLDGKLLEPEINRTVADDLIPVPVTVEGGILYVRRE